MSTDNKADLQSLVEALQPLIKSLRTVDSCLKWKGRNLSWTDEPIDDAQILKHLNGGPRVGAALIQYGSSNTFSALLDLDSHDGVTPMPVMLELAGRLMGFMKEYGLTPIPFVSSGGKGIHIWCLWNEPQDAWSVRALMRQVLAKADLKDGARGVSEHEVEIFPKQNAAAEKRIIVDDKGHERVNRGSQVFLPLSGESVPIDPITLKLLPKEPDHIKWSYSAPVLSAVIEEKRLKKKSKSDKKVVGLETLKSALDAIDNDGDGVDYEDWFRIVAAIHYESGGSTEGIELARRFSRRSNKYNSDLLDYKWDSICDDLDSPATASVIFTIAGGFGWELDEHSSRIDEFNNKHFAVMAGNKVAVGSMVTDHTGKKEELRLYSCYDTSKYYANLPVIQVDKRRIPFFDHWMSHQRRRTYRGLVFEPEGFVSDEYYNLWRGFAVEPCEGDCSLYLALLRDVICSGDIELYQYCLAWMADAVQHPGHRPGTALVFRGGQGVGKGTIATYFGRLFGRHFVHITSAKHLVGNFNSHTLEALVIFADEAVWAGDHVGAGTLKALVTEDERIIERKGVDAFPIRNYVRLLMASNQDWIVPAGKDERRFAVIDVSDSHKQNLDYFGRVREQMNNGGGQQALLHYLLNHDISGINLRQIPMSGALDEQKVMSLTPLESWWMGKLEKGTMRGVKINAAGEWAVTVEALYHEYLELTRKRGLTHLDSASTFATKIRKLVPGITKWRPTVGNTRTYCWALPSLSACRASFPGSLDFEDDGDEAWSWIETGAFESEI